MTNLKPILLLLQYLRTESAAASQASTLFPFEVPRALTQQGCQCTGLPRLPVHCELEEWGAWSSCNATCTEDSYKTRNRAVKTAARYGGTPCVGALYEMEKCDCELEAALRLQACAEEQEGECCTTNTDEPEGCDAECDEGCDECEEEALVDGCDELYHED